MTLAERLQTKSSHINLRELGLEVVPEGLRKRTDATHVDLELNKIRELPVWLTELHHLEELRLDYNKFDQLPEVLVRMPNLTKVTISGMGALSAIRSFERNSKNSSKEREKTH